MSGCLYALLPAYIRTADAQQPGTPLAALLASIEEQVDVVAADIAQLYENWFIETCADWVVPYIGDLVGYTPLPESDLETVVPRSDVADTIANRSRKGTLAVLPVLARDVTGWPAVAIEGERALATTFSPLGVAALQPRVLDLRDRGALARLRDPRSVTARGVAAAGSAAAGSLTLAVSRLRAVSVSRSDAACVVTQGDHCYTFDALGFDVPLVSALEALPTELRPADALAEYGAQKSFALWTRAAGPRSALVPVAREAVVSADLGHWRFRPRPDQVAVDVARGRICFAPGHAPDAVVVRYHYGAAADIGAGEYARDLVPIVPRFPVARDGREEQRQVRSAIARWRAAPAPRAAIEFGDTHVYDESDLHIDLPADTSLEIRAADGTRPVVRLEDRSAGHLDSLRISGGARSALVLDGLVIARRGIEISGEIATVVIRRCTLVPHECPIVVRSATVRLVIEQSVIGDIRTIEDETRGEPTRIEIADSIVGAHLREDALGSPGAPAAFVDLRAARSTFFGRVRVHGVSLIENAIFVQPLAVRRRETGCVRYSYLAPESLTPPGFACASGPAPEFMSRRFADPQYARLAHACAPAIAAGAEDRGEMGAFYALRNGQKHANLRARIAQYVPPGVRAEIRYLGER